MKRKKVLSIILAGILSFGLVSCGNSEETSSGGSSGGNKEIVFWSVFTGADGENMTKMIDDYNKTNPEYKVKHMPIEADDMYTKIPTVVGSGKDVPDVTIVHAERLALFAEKDLLQPLNQYIESSDVVKEANYVENAWAMGTINNQQYSIPLDVHSLATYYNKDLLEKYGPNVLDDGVITLDEVKEVGKKSSADNIAAFGLTWMRIQYLSFLAQINGDITTNGTEVNLDSPEAIEIFTELDSLVKDKIATQDGDDPGQLFRSGQLVFWPEGIWMQNSLAGIDINWGMTHMVTMDANNQKDWSSSHQFVMLKNEEMTDEKAKGIMEFVNWIGENSLEWAKAGQVPANYAIRENEEFKAMPQAFVLEDSSKLKLYDYKYYGNAVEALDKVVFEAAFGRMTPEDAAAAMQKEASEKIQMAQ
ncbi:extracellular solute-binding protein [Clostridium sp. AL.422]|uniref:extracellular solute-binding protein n=1 Tax=Clostridium TaxID=1485 RepID=UPI00293DBAE1|nr:MULTISPECIES: extracellular solute-binding protein [unclassified Clostridium]MDV4151861.1 extracellular solute-binding protein [Clostridium sp. AL.422]